jgi:hypothetical protein
MRLEWPKADNSLMSAVGGKRTLRLRGHFHRAWLVALSTRPTVRPPSLVVGRTQLPLNRGDPTIGL